MKISNSSLSLVTRVGLTLGMILNTGVALATDSATLSLSPSAPSQSVSLDGTVSHTIYRTEEYQTTCTREEPYTEYRTECDYRTVQSCHLEGGGESCRPECREVIRQVCNSRGCQNVSTHECTQSCTSNPSREVCSNHQEAYNCHQVPYTAYRTVEYSCTKTREVPIGTEVDKIISANVTVNLTGDVAGLTGKDSIKVSVANGNDISRPDLAVELVSSADTHFLRITKTDSSTNSGQNVLITSKVTIEAIPLTSVLSQKTNLVSLDANRGSVTVVTSGQPVDESTILKIVSKKDQFIGGLKTDLEKTLTGKDLQVTDASGGQKVVANFGSCVNGRPHEMTVTVTHDAGILIGGEILNPSAIEKAKGLLSTTISKRLNMTGAAAVCTAADSQSDNQQSDSQN